MTIAGRTAAAAVVGGTVAAATGGNFANGARSAAYAELFNDLAHETMEKMQELDVPEMAEFRNTPPTMVETFMDCGGQLMQDTTFQVLAGITAPSAPISKKVAKDYGLIPRDIGVGGSKVSRYTNLYSIVDNNIGGKTDNLMFRSITKTSNVLRGIGRSGTYYWLATGSYSAGYMGKCIYENYK